MVQNSIGRCIDDAGVTRSVGCDTPGTVHATEKVTAVAVSFQHSRQMSIGRAGPRLSSRRKSQPRRALGESLWWRLAQVSLPNYHGQEKSTSAQRYAFDG